MKVSAPSVRMLVAALLGLFCMPLTAGAITTTSTTYKVSMTAYNAVPEQTSSHPDVTASGAFSNPNVVAARSQDMAAQLPFGTIIEIDNVGASANCGYGLVGDVGYRVIADVMNKKWHDKIDILLPQKSTLTSGKTANPAVILGNCNNVTIKVVGYVPIAKIPKTQSQLVASVDANSNLAVAK